MKPLLNVKKVTVEFEKDDQSVKPVENISFQVNEKETVCIVGESGSGKSVTSLAILRLVEYENGKVSEGEILFNGENLLNKNAEEMRQVRGQDISMIFQEPMTALNPVLTIGRQIIESMVQHKKISKKEAKKQAIELLDLVGINDPETRYHQYPHELSGGMKQRVMIAIALACNPKLLIADEPTTALDVTIEAQILKLINRLKEQFNMSVIMITHDMGVAAEVADQIVVMYAGKVVEVGNVFDLFDDPHHPYTIGLMKSVPTGEGGRKSELPSIKGSVPSLTNMPKGCRFANRCQFATELCVEKEPPLELDENGRQVACWHVDQVKSTKGGEMYEADGTQFDRGVEKQSESNY